MNPPVGSDHPTPVDSPVVVKPPHWALRLAHDVLGLVGAGTLLFALERLLSFWGHHGG